MLSNNVTILKLGGSIITDKTKPYTANIQAIKDLSRQIKKANVPLIISHGSGSFGHTSAKKYGGTKGYKSLWGISKVSRDAMEINRIVMDILIEEKIPAISLRPMSMMITNKGQLDSNLFEVIPLVLNQGLIPVIYGDVIWDKSWKSTIYSGEKTISALIPFLKAKKIKVSHVIQVGITDGIYDTDGKTIKEITNKNYKTISAAFFRNKSSDVTGGVRHKVESSLKSGKSGIKTYIINGTIKNNLYKAISGKPLVCTVIY